MTRAMSASWSDLADMALADYHLESRMTIN